MTGTPFCMLPVTSFNGIKIGDGKVSKIFKMILNRWSDNVGIDIENQIKNWDKDNNSELNSNNSPSPYQFKPKN